MQVKEGLVEVQKTLKMGDVSDFSNFMSAVIDKKAFDRISGYINDAKSGPDTKIGQVHNKFSRIFSTKYIQSLTKAIIFELFYYINGYFRV